MLGGVCRIVAVYTKPDRKAGRGQRFHASPVKIAALAHGLPLDQPEIWDQSACDALASLCPDLAIVVDYGMILPETFLDIPHLGCANLHLSLLPRWRGAAPVARAIEAGDKTTGVSLMKLVPTLDAGPIIARHTCRIETCDTAAVLSGKLVKLGTRALALFMRDAERLLGTAEPQDEAGVCYAHKLSKDEAWIDWRRPAEEIERKVCALNPWPVAQMCLNGMTLRIWKGEVRRVEADRPGRVVADGGCLLVHCGQDALAVKRLQLPGGRIMRAQEFLNGHNVGEDAFSPGQPDTR